MIEKLFVNQKQGITISEREVLAAAQACYLACGISGLPASKASELFNSETRGVKEIATARQVAIYFCAVGLGIPIARTAKMFSRDRTTVMHAIRRIEDLRDNPENDKKLDEGIDVLIKMFELIPSRED